MIIMCGENWVHLQRHIKKLFILLFILHGNFKESESAKVLREGTIVRNLGGLLLMLANLM